MKTFTLIFISAMAACVFNVANAQRPRVTSPVFDRGNHGSNGFQQQSRNAAPARNFQNNVFRNNNAITQRNDRTFQRNERFFSPQRSNMDTRIQQRNAITRNDQPTTIPQRRNSNQIVNTPYTRQSTTSGYNRFNNSRYNNNYYAYNRNRYNGYGNRYYRGGGYYTFNHRNYAFMYGPRYTVIPRSFISIHFGGYPYYYNDGCFYGYYSGWYQPLFPPVGIRIRILPFGYSTLFIGGFPYYYYNGIYYRQYENDYEVVDPPMGATVYNLPDGAKSVVLNGEELYELNGTYYKQEEDAKGRIFYTVVGKNGEVNNTDEINNDNNDNSLSTPPSSLQMGDMVEQLPEGSKSVTVNGEKLYVTPDNTYLKEENNDGVIQYEVVGK